jgi:hypothetical protein
MKHTLIIIFTLLSFGFINAQDKTLNNDPGLPPAAVMIDIAYGMQNPYGDMKTNFNYNYNIGARINYLTPRNWIFAVSGEYLFSDNIKTDVLKPLRESNGNIIETTGRMGLTQLGERGYMIGGQAGKLIQLGKKTRMHNLEIKFGGAYLQHWIRIRLLGRPVELPQLFEDYKKGYDRMTSGIALNQYVGYRFMSRSKLVNLFIGLDFTEGFTYNRRFYNFDTREADTKLHKDILLGFRAGFSIPFFIYSENTRNDELEFY